MAKLKATSVAGNLTVTGSIEGTNYTWSGQSLDERYDSRYYKVNNEIQDFGIIAGGTTSVNLDNGYKIQASITADSIFNFTSSFANVNITWEVLLTSTGGKEPTFQFDGVDVNIPDGYDIAGDAAYLFTFTKYGSGVYVTERKFS